MNNQFELNYPKKVHVGDISVREGLQSENSNAEKERASYTRQIGRKSSIWPLS